MIAVTAVKAIACVVLFLDGMEAGNSMYINNLTLNFIIAAACVLVVVLV